MQENEVGAEAGSQESQGSADTPSAEVTEGRRSTRRRSATGRRSKTAAQRAATAPETPEDTLSLSEAADPEAAQPAAGTSAAEPAPAKGRSTRQSGTRKRGRKAAELAQAEGADEPARVKGQTSEPEPPEQNVSTADDAGVAGGEVLVSDQPSATRAKRERKSRDKPKRIAQLHEALRARIAIRKGLPEIVVGGETVPPVMLFANVQTTAAARTMQSEAKRALARGVRILSTLVELVCPIPPDGSVYRMLDERLGALADTDPRAYLFPRVVFVPGEHWREQYPMDMQSYGSRRGEDPSIASEHFWLEAGRALRLMIEHISRTSYGWRVIGYHLERGEWFQPADAGFDVSYANREGFRRWLRERYHDNEVELRASWFDGQAQFYTAAIPPVPEGDASTAWFDPRTERRWVDFMEYTSDITARRLTDLAGVVKEATGGAALVSACYGYTWEFGHPWSGHLALRRVLECPDIDILTGPISYAERQPGSSGAMPTPVDSVLLHGKLWMVEDDTKTHLARGSSAADPYNPRMENRQATEAVHRRTIGAALAHQHGIAWMDLWGEGWLDSDEIWQTAGQFAELATRQARFRRRTSPEVVALLDETSLCYFNGSGGLMQRVLQGHREALLRCGASVGFYLQSDVTHKDFPTDARLYLFLNPYSLPEDQRAAIREKLRGGGRTLVWFCNPGGLTSRTGYEEGAPEVVGLNVRPQPWNSEIGTRIVDSSHPITQGLHDRVLGSPMRLNPSFYVDDDSPGVTVLGEYVQTGLPSLVVRSADDCHTVFCGEPILTPELLRGLCRFAGVHVYTRLPEDYVQAGYGWVSVHVLRDGYRTLSLPEGTVACDVIEEAASAAGSREFRTPVRARTTRLFYIGTSDDARRLGLSWNKRRSESPEFHLPPPPPLPSFAEEPEPQKAEPEPVGVEPVVGDVGTESGGDAAGAAPKEAAAEPSGSRRKRRRGGRGRGRKKRSPVGAEEEHAPVESSGTEPGNDQHADGGV